MEALRSAVMSHRCRAVPTKILEVENHLKSLYDADQEALEHAEFQKLDPVDAAKKDTNRFLARFFLDADRKLDLSKAPAAMVLPEEPGSSLKDAVQRLNGVHVATSAGYPDQRMMLVIGTDSSKVSSATERVNAEQLCAIREERMERHRKLIRKSEGGRTYYRHVHGPVQGHRGGGHGREAADLDDPR